MSSSLLQLSHTVKADWLFNHRMVALGVDKLWRQWLWKVYR